MTTSGMSLGEDPPRPSSYRLLLPEGWARIRLSPHEVLHDVELAVRGQFRGIPGATETRRQLTKELMDHAAAAQLAGGIELFLSFMAAPPVTIPAALLVCVTPPNPSVPDLASLREAILAAGIGDPMELVQLPSGDALRRPRLTRIGADRFGVSTLNHSGKAVNAFGLDYHFAVPQAPGSFLLLSFSSPVPALQDALTGLFDAVAETLEWVA